MSINRKGKISMENKFKFKDNPTLQRIVYAAVIVILCVSALVLGIVAAASKSKDNTPPIDEPPIGNEGGDNGGGNEETPDGGNETPTPQKPLAFVSPVVGTVTKHHDLDTPVFSLTLGAWKIHSGIDIETEEGAVVYAAEDGTISKIYNDPMLGYTVEITHRDNIVTRYSCLDEKDIGMIAVGDVVVSGDRIGTVGDSSVSEMADEAHLHFSMLVGGVAVNPLDYITEDSQSASLGITVEK